MTELVVGFLFVVAGLAWAELKEWLPWLAHQVVARAVLALPAESRARMIEELTAEVAAVPGKVSPLVFACSIWWGFSKTALFTRIDLRLSQHVLRMTDLVFAGLLLLIVAPMLLATLIATSVSCGRFGLQRAYRLGRNGSLFRLVTFQIRHSATGEMTACGHVVHRLGLDCLPILVSVLRGDMSLVGPPPLILGNVFSGAQFSLKPGVVWKNSAPGECLDGFGISTIATLRLYFKLLWAGIRSAD